MLLIKVKDINVNMVQSLNTSVRQTSNLKIGARRLLFCKKTSCPVATMEETFATIQRCHDRVGHSGRDKTFICSNQS